MATIAPNVLPANYSFTVTCEAENHKWYGNNTIDMQTQTLEPSISFSSNPVFFDNVPPNTFDLRVDKKNEAMFCKFFEVTSGSNIILNGNESTRYSTVAQTYRVTFDSDEYGDSVDLMTTCESKAGTKLESTLTQALRSSSTNSPVDLYDD